MRQRAGSPVKAVVVYSRVGGGHLSAARGLGTELESTGVCRVRLVDAYLECGRFPLTSFPAAYAWMASHHPRLWSLVYHGSAHGLNPGAVVGLFLRSGFRQLMVEENPDVVISLLPVINGVLAEVARQAGARLEVVLTDWHSVHPFWEAAGVDHYTAPTESARNDCIRFGAPPSAIDVIGIPVRREFTVQAEPLAGTTQASEPRARRLAELGLDPSRFTILMTVGAVGSPRAVQNVASLAAAGLDAQLVVVCGGNEELRARVRRLVSPMPVKALGFVDGMADLMRASDVLVTKAGGLTLAEAFCCGIPVVIHDVLPGQERGNLEYVLRQEAVVYAPRPGALVRAVSELRSDPIRRADLVQRGARLARPHAARDIAQNVLRRLDGAP